VGVRARQVGLCVSHKTVIPRRGATALFVSFTLSSIGRLGLLRITLHSCDKKKDKRWLVEIHEATWCFAGSGCE
jgi:hypothetical protein